MFLTEAVSDKRLKILEIKSGLEIKRKLLSMGIHPEDKLVKLTKVNWGAVLIQNLTNGSTKLALGRRLAEKIVVEYES